MKISFILSGNDLEVAKNELQLSVDKDRDSYVRLSVIIAAVLSVFCTIFVAFNFVGGGVSGYLADLGLFFAGAVAALFFQPQILAING